MSKISDDPRIDPRIKAIFGAIDLPQPEDFPDRDALMADANRPESVAEFAGMVEMFEMVDNEQIAPKEGLDISTVEFTSTPDNNTVKIQMIRPQADGPLPCVYYIHGGGMQSMSCYDGMYRSWGRILAHQGVAVAMVDFRNAVRASSAPEVAPFPAGLNDCVSGLKYIVEHADELGIDPGHVIVAAKAVAEI